MADSKEWREPAGKNIESYEIDVTTIAPLKEIVKGNLKTTGKDIEGKKYPSKNIRSDELAEGMSIAVENGEERE